MGTASVATIGTFDGVHRGHQFVVNQVVRQARECGLESVVVTFSNHPLQVLREGFTPQLLSLTEEKVERLRQTAIDKVVLLDFTPQLAQMSAHDFMQQVLAEQMGVKMLLIGYDNHFGHDRKGFDDCVIYGKELGIEVVACDPLAAESNISSTAVRKALLAGDIETANTMLGYHYSLQGIVVAGFQNGRKLGYPTANLQIAPEKLIPQNGVYLIHTHLGFGMLNVGSRPTLHNGRQRSIEAHIFDFDGDLYGTTLQVELLHHLRHEQEFDTLEALRHQLTQDEQACRSFIKKETHD